MRVGNYVKNIYSGAVARIEEVVPQSHTLYRIGDDYYTASSLQRVHSTLYLWAVGALFGIVILSALMPHG